MIDVFVISPQKYSAWQRAIGLAFRASDPGKSRKAENYLHDEHAKGRLGLARARAGARVRSVATKRPNIGANMDKTIALAIVNAAAAVIVAIATVLS